MRALMKARGYLPPYCDMALTRDNMKIKKPEDIEEI
jgi:hypothetical protein